MWNISTEHTDEHFWQDLKSSPKTGVNFRGERNIYVLVFERILWNFWIAKSTFLKKDDDPVLKFTDPKRKELAGSQFFHCEQAAFY